MIYAAYLLITCHYNKVDQVLTHLRKLDDVKEIQGTCGMYDMIAKIELESYNQLRQFVVDKINPMEDIRTSITLRCAQDTNNTLITIY